MRLLDTILKRSGQRGYVPEPDAWSGWVAGAYSHDGNEGIAPTFAAYAGSAYAGNAIVYAIIAKRMAVLSEARFKWRRLSDDSLYGTPALSILERPWPGGTTGELLARMEQDTSLAGNAFIARQGDQLTRLRPDWVTIVSEESADDMGRAVRTVVGYAYGDPSTSRLDVFDVSEVAHYSPYPDPLANFRGMSWLTPVVREINADQAMTDHKRAYFDNYAQPNLAIKYDKALSPETLRALSDRFAAGYQGTGNAGKTLVLDGGADVTLISASMEASNFTAVQAAGENRIAAASGVPGIVVGLKEGLSAATYSNYEQAMRNFADTTARPWWRGACAALAKLVDVPDGAELWFDVAAIAALRQGEKERAETTQIQAAAALNLVNAGYDPSSIAPALSANDLTLLAHTGLVPTLLAPPGQNPNAPTGSDDA